MPEVAKVGSDNARAREGEGGVDFVANVRGDGRSFGGVIVSVDAKIGAGAGPVQTSVRISHNHGAVGKQIGFARRLPSIPREARRVG